MKTPTHKSPDKGGEWYQDESGKLTQVTKPTVSAKVAEAEKAKQPQKPVPQPAAPVITNKE